MNRSKQQQPPSHGNGASPTPVGVASSESNNSRLQGPSAVAVLAFRRDLPRLLEQHSRQWVAYCGDRQMGFAATKTKLYQQLLAMDLPATSSRSSTSSLRCRIRWKLIGRPLASCAKARGAPVALFLDKFPFDRWIDQTRLPPEEHWSIVLPLSIWTPQES
jgi:hypothetical protein